uniref:Uncharacterized protein n=1 Tax=Strombidinopsis acuminata TaxID=141414 RepID=A0A7S3RN06_9SPIT|mmetsp:Transcript_16277/g.45510  ORF Transcript_16277/g.45510 Transcript_16277/m.45510 type:complete len:205 (-) Transcript_16277:473-1087(-)|eukprot:scaffold121963_cov34-Tisochrysis_lutea.AAC.1
MELDISSFEARQQDENEAFAANIAAKRAAARAGRLTQPTLIGGVVSHGPSSSSSSPSSVHARSSTEAEDGDAPTPTPTPSPAEAITDGRKKALIWRCYSAHPEKDQYQYWICQEIIQEVGANGGDGARRATPENEVKEDSSKLTSTAVFIVIRLREGSSLGGASPTPGARPGAIEGMTAKFSRVIIFQAVFSHHECMIDANLFG